MRIRTILTAAAVPATLAAALLGTTAASASTTGPTGPGFVGKGDVQAVYGLNDPTLQKDASGISFQRETTDSATYDLTIKWDTGKIGHVQHHVQTRTDRQVSDTVVGVDGKPRTNPNAKVNGFLLGADIGAPVVTGDDMTPPQVGDRVFANENANENATEALVTDVQLTDSSSSTVLRVFDGVKAPAASALDGYNVWDLANGLNPVTGSINVGTANGSVY